MVERRYPLVLATPGPQSDLLPPAREEGRERNSVAEHPEQQEGGGAPEEGRQLVFACELKAGAHLRRGGSRCLNASSGEEGGGAAVGV